MSPYVPICVITFSIEAVWLFMHLKTTGSDHLCPFVCYGFKHGDDFVLDLFAVEPL